MAAVEPRSLPVARPRTAISDQGVKQSLGECAIQARISFSANERSGKGLPLDNGSSRRLRGDALTARAASLGIVIEEFQDADGSVRELDLQRRIREIERYSAEFRFDKVFAVCVAAFGICGVATWLAMHFLAHQ
jgi:hypothetical protein